MTVRFEGVFKIAAYTDLQPGNGSSALPLFLWLSRTSWRVARFVELMPSDSLRSDMPETLYALGRAPASSERSVAQDAFTRVIELEKDIPLAPQA